MIASAYPMLNHREGCGAFLSHDGQTAGRVVVPALGGRTGHTQRTMNDHPTDHPLAHLDGLTRKRRALLHALVWEGRNVRASAQAAGMSEQAAHLALRSRNFQAAMDGELKVRRRSARLGNIPALERVRDTSQNGLAVVAAAKALELIASEDDTGAAGNRAIPGIVIMIGGEQQIAGLSQQQAKPLISLHDVGGSHGQRVRSSDDDA